ncbi:hypothetical protein H920_10785 [Fukomys damarensis]|uniref:Uncharacterized protein n=1 Tax=Fukomys damarensis TaxID=885580 RepID=A0A091DC03_FUKDA|nr:hypothetical protein H920_10785 [Fukomys damarensis]
MLTVAKKLGPRMTLLGVTEVLQTLRVQEKNSTLDERHCSSTGQEICDMTIWSCYERAIREFVKEMCFP